MIRKLVSNILLAAVLILLAGASVSVASPNPKSTVAFRIENFVRALETSGIDAQSRFYQFRGMNLATSDGHRASSGCHLSVT